MTAVNAIAVMAALLGAAPVAYWPLQEDSRDYSGAALRGVNHGVSFSTPAPDGAQAARFDGRQAFIEVAHNPLLPFGQGDFTVSLWVFTEAALDDGLGDLLGKYDADARRGINFGLANYGGVSNSQPNHRNVFAGMDNGVAPGPWRDCGRPGNAVFIFAMAVYKGDLFAATCESGADETGRVYRYAGDANWEDCGNPDNRQPLNDVPENHHHHQHIP